MAVWLTVIVKVNISVHASQGKVSGCTPNNNNNSNDHIEQLTLIMKLNISVPLPQRKVRGCATDSDNESQYLSTSTSEES